MTQIIPARRLFSACAILLLSCCTFAQTPLRVAAANVTSDNYQSYQAPGIRILKALQPDVILIQEFNVNTTSGGPNDDTAVQNWINTNFSGYSWFREAGAQIPNGIISKYPIVASGEWNDSQVSNRDFAWARIDVPGPNDLYAVSVHLLSTSSSNRNAEAQALVNTYIPSLAMPAGSYLVLGGDFNTGSRSESCISTFSGTFVTASPYPVGQDGDPDTNAGRNSPYDWVLPNPTLNAIKTSTAYGSFLYANGLVFDTRNFTQAQLNSSFTPALVADSDASNMQHMAVVRTFLIPSTTPVTNGDNAALTVTNRAPATSAVNVTIPMQSVSLSVAANEWDAGSVTLTKTGTLADANVTARIYLDANNNGAIDSGETVLSTSGFSAGVATLALSPPPRAAPGSPINLLAAATISAAAPDAATLRYTLTSVVHSASGGNDTDPPTGGAQSGIVTVSNPPTPPVSTPVAVNKYYNDGTLAANDAVELLVAQNNLDMRGMVIKDFSSSMASDGGGKFTFSSNALWSSVRAGTVIVLRNNTTAADVNVGGNDWNLDVGMANTTYFTNSGGTFDISGTEMVMIKTGASGAAGTSGNIHTLAGGTAGAQYTATSAPKLRATSGATSGQFVYAENSNGTTATASRLSNFNDGSGIATGAATGLNFGAGNTAANTDFITFLRGPVSAPATLMTATSFQANWNPLVTATSYRLDVATDSAFSSILPDYNNLDVGNTTSYNVVGLAGAANYYYRVRGQNVEPTPSGNSAAVTVTGVSRVEKWELY